MASFPSAAGRIAKRDHPRETSLYGAILLRHRGFHEPHERYCHGATRSEKISELLNAIFSS